MGANTASDIFNMSFQLEKLATSLKLAANELVSDRKQDAIQLETIKAELSKADPNQAIELQSKLDSLQSDLDAAIEQLKSARAENESLKKKLLEARIANAKIFQDDVVIATLEDATVDGTKQ